ncbi:nitroreductase family deazaflavin-dependent oxidoreductase [Mycolicibacterium sp. CH28]|uniref:nitroreductase family deazaflavin-dependent oxidoreductase n=1 Tax=Mycolicibacterium sp. CH28 TaxID=2512237 RepID=UPI001081458A|nr:nitroreductase family deazaflavin-dependent oxidoreductase [Mycolicibacterium sp. CH28]TGD86163.1 nitroreductase family deazaflavin-dependent oxidoreductase [Mycolicibacterium sp. CH28]
MQPPTALRRVAYRLPIYVYRLGLGWLFGGRIMLLNHTGRISGKRRQAILEVVEHDRADGSYVVASGWGSAAAWYRNVLKTPEVSIEVGRTTLPMVALPLTEDEGAEVFARYATRHRVAAKLLLPRVLGFTVDGSASDFREVGRRLPFIRFVTPT